MTPQDLVCSRELSKQLEKLGVPQESYFYWTKKLKMLDGEKGWEIWEIRDAGHEQFSAFTSSELGMLLPECYITERRLRGNWECSQDFVSTSQDVGSKSFPENHTSYFAPTEADARAKCLIDLLERKLITL